MATATQPAARARAMSPEQKMARSHELAERDHLLYRSRYAGLNDAGEAIFTVPSRSQAYREHVVRRTPTGIWECSCEAAQYNLPCAHLGAARHHWHIIERAMTAAAAEANRQYHAMCEWIEQRGW